MNSVSRLNLLSDWQSYFWPREFDGHMEMYSPALWLFTAGPLSGPTVQLTHRVTQTPLKQFPQNAAEKVLLSYPNGYDVIR